MVLEADELEELVEEVKAEALSDEPEKPDKWLFRFICKSDFDLYKSTFDDICDNVRLSSEVSYMGMSYVRGEGIDLSKDIMFIYGEDAQLFSEIWDEAYTKIVNVAVLFSDKTEADLTDIHDVFFVNHFENESDIRMRFKLFVSYLLYNTGALEMLS